MGHLHALTEIFERLCKSKFWSGRNLWQPLKPPRHSDFTLTRLTLGGSPNNTSLFCSLIGFPGGKVIHLFTHSSLHAHSPALPLPPVLCLFCLSWLSPGPLKYIDWRHTLQPSVKNSSKIRSACISIHPICMCL